ncbi:adenosine kinase [Acidiferrimicrobium sp. IK]|uniref:adenosine kinase n=1 Tax=Acidiferrimicrobium sp. IK TaxID=2871700 RepID=UPI0021CB8921|nr:adenosine kinase [Acidiferrimicrobium sp. IK]MCU4185433.1 adenosine kinase [Acidiferrimicrobium sp. IK]
MRAAPRVVTVGHAIVDVLTAVPDEIVAGFGLSKGTMTLVDEAQSEAMYRTLVDTTAVSGGSAANTAVGVAELGARVAFLGKVRDDELGAIFAKDIRAAGVEFSVPLGHDGPGTGRCIVMVTSDAEKTMCTMLGIGDLLGPDDIDVEAVAGADVVYLEGYLCGLHSTDATVERTIATAEAAGTLVSLSLSDPFWVELHGDALDPLLDRVDLLFGNEQEACGMAGTDDFEKALAILSRRCATVAVTRGAAGSVVAADGRVSEIPAEPVGRVVDTTGAGDLFAAGYLYGVVSGFDPARCARLGGLAAAEVISHMGARPQVPLSGLIARSEA